jgi:hypothetical protein
MKERQLRRLQICKSGSDGTMRFKSFHCFISKKLFIVGAPTCLHEAKAPAPKIKDSFHQAPKLDPWLDSESRFATIVCSLVGPNL